MRGGMDNLFSILTSSNSLYCLNFSFRLTGLTGARFEVQWSLGAQAVETDKIKTTDDLTISVEAAAPSACEASGNQKRGKRGKAKFKRRLFHNLLTHLVVNSSD